MKPDTIASLRVLKELRVSGRIVEYVKRARKGQKCTECGLPIEPGTEYCRIYIRIYIGGAGLLNLKFPDKVHMECLDKTLDIGGKSGRDYKPDATAD